VCEAACLGLSQTQGFNTKLAAYKLTQPATYTKVATQAAAGFAKGHQVCQTEFNVQKVPLTIFHVTGRHIRSAKIDTGIGAYGQGFNLTSTLRFKQRVIQAESFQRAVDGCRRPFAGFDGLGHGTRSVDDIASGKDSTLSRLHGIRIRADQSALNPHHAADSHAGQIGRLSNRQNYVIGFYI
jgi:hypothetical protein